MEPALFALHRLKKVLRLFPAHCLGRCVSLCRSGLLFRVLIAGSRRLSLIPLFRRLAGSRPSFFILPVFFGFRG